MRKITQSLLSVLLLAGASMAMAQQPNMPDATATCDPRNPTHVPVDQVKINVTKATNANDSPNMYCWTYIGAMLGVPLYEAGYGSLLHQGTFGVRKDLRAAFLWLKKASEHGSPYGAECLAFAYLYGEGTPVNLPEAQRWYDVALKDPLTAEQIQGLIAGHDVPLRDNRKMPNGMTVDEWNALTTQAAQEEMDRQKKEDECAAQQTQWEEAHQIKHRCNN
jgi:hypothetical protein